KEENTKALLKAMDNPYVKVLAHPGNVMYPIDVEKIVAKAKKKGILIEINNSSFTGSREGSEPNCLEIAKEVRKQDWKVVIGSDAHASHMLGDYSEAIKLVKKAGLKDDQVVNTSEELIREYILNRDQ
ncbi:MAG: phosphatase, partial [bacterium]